MGNLKQASISKSRSYTACLSEAHSMLFDNLHKIFSRTWIYSLVMALVSAVYLSLYVHVMLYGNNNGLTIALCVSSLALLSAEIAYYAKVMNLLNGRPMRWNIARCANIAACYIAFCVVLAFVSAFVVYGTVMAKQPVTLAEIQPLLYTIGGVSVIIMLLLLPFIYVAMKYLMEPESKFVGIIFKAYKTGLRHWGLIFTTLFIATLCASICALLVSIPMLIVLIANALSVYGVNFIGDPTGLPQYFTAIQFVVYALTFFIWAYVNIFIIFVCYFLYGSIATREKEKQELKKKLKD